MVGEIIYRKAGLEDVGAITEFVVGCIRFAFTQKTILGPQDYYKSDVFPKDYLQIRQNSLSNPTTMSSIAIDSETSQVIGYIEFGPKKPYLKDLDCQSEILCYFVGPQMQGQGVGKALLANIIQLAHNSRTFTVGHNSIGILTLRGNPSIAGFYKKIGVFPAQEYEFNVSLENLFSMKSGILITLFFSSTGRLNQYWYYSSSLGR